jgi:hypothetical protein
LGAASKGSSSNSGSTAESSGGSSRLLVGLHEGVQQLTPRGAGEGVDIVTSSRR